jgi:hypothetical protein
LCEGHNSATSILDLEGQKLAKALQLFWGMNIFAGTPIIAVVVFLVVFATTATAMVVAVRANRVSTLVRTSEDSSVPAVSDVLAACAKSPQALACGRVVFGAKLGQDLRAVDRSGAKSSSLAAAGPVVRGSAGAAIASVDRHGLVCNPWQQAAAVATTAWS